MGTFGTRFPTDNSQIDTVLGDIVLYQGNSISFFYDNNSRSYTMLGKLDITDVKEIKTFLAAEKGKTDIILSLKYRILQMAITVNLYYTGTNENARKFAEEMTSSGVVQAIREEKGNLKYEYFFPMDDPETVLLIDSWENQEAIDEHHKTPMMQKIMELREKYDLHMKIERYRSDDDIPERDKSFIRK